MGHGVCWYGTLCGLSRGGGCVRLSADAVERAAILRTMHNGESLQNAQALGAKEMTMAHIAMRDLIIMLPGMLGSVLQKDGQEVWSPALTAAARVLQRECLGRDLVLPTSDDPDLDDLGDGIQAVRLMPTIHMLPGFWAIDGYTTIWSFLTDAFDVKPGTLDQPDADANLFAFPYDWRRDNCVAARRLKLFVDQQLPRWRAASGASQAKVVVIAHSMGGLVARHYLEVLGGWEYCRALFTFGTPYCGSVKALGALCQGIKFAQSGVNEALRSFDSVYQLLPTYPVVQSGDRCQRVAECEGLPGVVRERAQRALAFHRAIDAAAQARLADEQRRLAYATFPIVGIQQPTLQSVHCAAGRVIFSADLPVAMHEQGVPADGDGTVPYASAVPAELVEERRAVFAAERHSALHAHDDVLEHLRNHLARLQVRDWGAMLGPKSPTRRTGTSAISLALEDVYCTTESITIRAQVLGAQEQVGALAALITPFDSSHMKTMRPLQETDAGWALTLEALSPGLYRIAVHADRVGAGVPNPVHAVFEVVA